MTPAEIPWKSLHRRFGDEFWEACVATPLPTGLSEIDAVHWANVESCYTPRLIPLMLRGLCSEEALVRDRALACLGDEVLHQGSTFQSSKRVVRFLIQLLEAEALIDEVWVRDLIRSVGLWALAPLAWRKEDEALEVRPRLGRQWHESGFKKWEWGLPSGSKSASGKTRLRFMRWYDSGALELEGSYVQASGNTWLEESHAQGYKDGAWTQWRPNGECLGTYEMQEGTGTELMWHDNGQLHRQVGRLAGVQDGRVVSWFDSGQLEEESTFDAGKRTGPWKCWRPDGSIEREGVFKNNVEHGIFVHYDPDGNPEQSCGYQRGKRHGLSSSYTAGVLVTEGRFKKGKRDGIWQHWDDSGNLQRSVTWKMNKMCKVERQ